ncbi:uncharacterized protein METZ01_LOCUS389394 [marine metagenome]|uniref:Uncharacterized protein n=1 Tax=marine metagenome TaxID=408172 RepID=A0A382UQQ8_9ZZZZ
MGLSSEIAFTFFRLGLLGFGGPTPRHNMEEEFVDQKGWRASGFSIC